MNETTPAAIGADTMREAERLLRRDAESLRQTITPSCDRNDWVGSGEAKAEYDEYLRVADGLAALANAPQGDALDAIDAARAKEPAMQADKKLVGHCYIASYPCGLASAMAWDEENPEHKKALSRTVAAWIERGDSVNLVARYDGDPIPESILDCPCRRGEKEPCK